LHYAKNKRNEIEQFIYSTRGKLEGELNPYVTPEESEVLIKLMNDMEEWFYSGDEEVFSKSAVDTKSKELNELGGKIYKRFFEWNKLADSVQNAEKVLGNCLNNYNERLDNFKKGNSPYLTQQDFDKIGTLINTFRENLAKYKEIANNAPKAAEPNIGWDFHKNTEELVKVK
jgi:hypothetical protein